MISKNHKELINNIVNYETNNDKDMYQKRIIYNSLIKIDNPVVLEFGVNTGASSSLFAYLAEKKEGHVYSVDIKDCHDVVLSENWSFLKTDDLDTKKILKTFEKLFYGIDLIYIDSYHDSEHIKKLAYNWFPFLKKNGIMFVDDTDNLIYREKKLIPHTVNVGEINEMVNKIYASNHSSIIYSKTYGSSGLSSYIKTNNFGEGLKPIKNIWTVNFFIKYTYIYMRKIFKYLKK